MDAKLAGRMDRFVRWAAADACAGGRCQSVTKHEMSSKACYGCRAARIVKEIDKKKVDRRKPSRHPSAR